VHHLHEPLAVTIAFIDRINHGDVDGLAALMADDYELRVFDEEPQRGRESGIAGWRGYAAAFPDYVISPTRLAQPGSIAAVLGYSRFGTTRYFSPVACFEYSSIASRLRAPASETSRA
jgi:ketosteroid isomerase-like protein